MKWLSHGKLVTVLQFFTDSVDDYWHILYPLSDPEKRENDPYIYFYDISRKATDFSGPLSEDGIYLFKGYDGAWHLHALEISQYALACWLAWRKTDDERWLTKAMLHCDWLLDKQDDDGAWRIDHKNPKYCDLPSPWPSGMAQGLAISSLLRAYEYTKEHRYLDAAVRAAVFLETEIADGGVKRIIPEGFIYEEYPREQLSGVLNGYISALLGLYELAQYRSEYASLYSKNMENLKNILPLFDTGYWSYYALDGTIASGFYHRYVIIQLRALRTLDSSFEVEGQKFEHYLHCLFCMVKALWKKVRG